MQWAFTVMANKKGHKGTVNACCVPGGKIIAFTWAPEFGQVRTPHGDQPFQIVATPRDHTASCMIYGGLVWLTDGRNAVQKAPELNLPRGFSLT